MSQIAEALSVDILPALKAHGMPSCFRDQAAYDELVLRLERAPTFEDRVALNNDLVAMQNGEVAGSTKEQRSLAMSMSLLYGISIGAYQDEAPRLAVPEK